MNTPERLARIEEVETAVSQLVVKGWKVECVTHTDQDGEPFRTQIELAIEDPSTRWLV